MTCPPPHTYSDITFAGFPISRRCQPHEPDEKPKSKLTEKKIQKMINMRKRK